MTFIDLKGKELTLEMRMWIHRNTTSRWKYGEKMARNGVWRQRREVLGIWMDQEDASVFRLKFML
jgi:hypothetical protein